MLGASCGACGFVSFLGDDCGMVLEILPSNFGVERGRFFTIVNLEHQKLEVRAATYVRRL
jgi:hypothetical protein